MTAEEFERFPDEHAELVRGRVVVHEPPTIYHGVVVANLMQLIGAFARPRKLGVVFGEGGVKLASNPDTVRAPDVGFIRRDRGVAIKRRGFGTDVPDLAAEVMSPNDRPGEVLAKVSDFLRAGVPLVWVIDPARRVAHVYRQDGSLSVIAPDGTLDGESVLPGFRCPLEELFEDLE